jgi:hypothetical protein
MGCPRGAKREVINHDTCGGIRKGPDEVNTAMHNEKITVSKEEVNSRFSGHWQDFYSAFLDLRNGNGNESKVVCPFHQDSVPSLSVNNDTGLFHCFGCHAQGDAFSFYGKLKGLTSFPDIVAGMAADFGIAGNGKKQSKIVATYNYRDVEGTLLYQAVRMEPKSFRQRRPDGKGGWLWNMQGVNRVLYRLPEVRGAGLVFICEGEKDVDNLFKIGLTATTNVGGAGKWMPEYSAPLRGKSVVILADNDDPGRDHAQKVAGMLCGVAAAVKVIQLPGLPEKGDVTDWIKAGGDGGALIRIADDAPIWKPDVQQAGKFAPLTPKQTAVIISGPPAQPEAIISCYDRPLLVRGIVGELAAAGGTGKTFFLLSLAYHIAEGTGMGPLKAAREDGFEVLLLLGEDPQDEVERRLWAVSDGGYFPSKLHVASIVGHTQPLMMLKENNPVRAAGYDWLRETIKNHAGLEVLILDPKSRFYGLNENDNDHGTQWIACLESLSQEFGLTILFSHHVGKANSGKIEANMNRGASSIVDGCRWVAGLAPLAEGGNRYGIEDYRRYVELDVVKTNYAPGLPTRFTFERLDNGVLRYAALETQRRDGIIKILYESINREPSTFRTRDLKSGRKAVSSILEEIHEQYPSFKKTEMNGLIDSMIQGGLILEEEIYTEGPGAPKKVVKTIPIDLMNFAQKRF